ncbi:DUF4388 domain-containing protein [Vulgatibacter incomptus]|uniref:Response regulator n=1 Tax=Vulgatibacter incomptus TaxID=1391653 RepID=A0A0K1PAP8_9BACT|nr:DUF4388 domain-containing protein [Vulgatibacter incomptus]AKU90595.1 Response regulator [Vulgatibacter incomptus]
MALRGTIKDFGIAEILQLIGQQAKTGILHLESKSKDEEVHISFLQGNVVGAGDVGRRRRDLLGRMLVRAELLSDAQLEAALDEQKRTLKRLGDILVESGAMTRELLREMTRLQAQETLYRLFSWKSGTYRFEQVEVAWDKESFTPIRSEAVLMEGFRIVDEWPAVRRKIPSKEMTFERLAPLPAQRAEDDLDSNLDQAFGGAIHAGSGASEIGPAERRVMKLVEPGRSVETLIDLSRLGEFETTKALANLVSGGFLRGIAPEPSEARADRAGPGERLAKYGLRVGLSLALALVVGLVAHRASSGEGARSGTGVERTLWDPAAQRAIGEAQLSRIRFALELHRLETGAHPAALSELVEARLLGDGDLRYPWTEPYFYRRTEDRAGYVLLPPLR